MAQRIVDFKQSPSSADSWYGARVRHGSLSVIPVEDMEMHDGQALYFFDTDADIDIAGPKYYLFNVPNVAGNEYDVRVSVRLTAGALFEIFIDPTITLRGTRMTQHNRDHNGICSCAGQIAGYADPTVAHDGTRKAGHYLGGNFALVGDDVASNKFMARLGTAYLIKVTVLADNTRGSMYFEYSIEC